MAFASTPFIPSLRGNQITLRCTRKPTYQTAATPRMCEPTPQGPALPTPQVGVSDVNLSGNELDLMRAAYSGNAEGMKSAIDAGADVTCADVVGRTPLHFAGGHGLRSVAQSLLDGGAEVNAQDYGGYTALHLATCYMRMDTVRLLIDAGADPNKATYEGAGEGRLAVEIAEELVDAVPQRKVFGFEFKKDERQKRLDLYNLLDEVTEVEEDADEDVEEETARLERAAKALEGGDGTTVVVRKKSASAPKKIIDDAEVKVTVKSKPSVSSSAEESVQDATKLAGENSVAENDTSTVVDKPVPEISEKVIKIDDAEVTIRAKEESKSENKVKEVDDSDVKVTIRVKGKPE